MSLNGSYNFTKIKDPRGRQEFYRSLLQPRQAVFPQDCFIDTEQHMLCRFVGGKIVAVEPTKQTFWLWGWIAQKGHQNIPGGVRRASPDFSHVYTDRTTIFRI